MDVSQQIFTEEELSANNERKAKLCQLVASGDAIAIIGAGSSRISGFPLWGELLEMFENKVQESGISFLKREKKNKDDENDIAYAARLKQSLGVKRYDALINEIFGDRTKTFSTCHSALISLPFRGILTTNFDGILEQALTNKLVREHKYLGAPDLLIDDSINPREIYKFLRSLNEKRDCVEVIAHLHGDYRNLQSVVLCAEDYEKKYGIEITGRSYKDKNWTLYRRILWSLMSTRRIIYIGFSMNDDYFRVMHDIVCNDLGAYGQDTHYLIERVVSKEEVAQKGLHARTLKEKYGIETVFYRENTAGNGLEQFINELENEIGVSKTQTFPEDKIKPKRKRKVKVNEELNKQLIEKALKNSDEN